MSYSCSHDIVDYIAKLNRVSSEPDILSPNTDHFSLDNNLAMFSNTQFFDFDLGHDADLQSVPVKATADLVAPLAGMSLLFLHQLIFNYYCGLQLVVNYFFCLIYKVLATTLKFNHISCFKIRKADQAINLSSKKILA